MTLIYVPILQSPLKRKFKRCDIEIGSPGPEFYLSNAAMIIASGTQEIQAMILFPSHFLDPKRVDDDYRTECLAARELGLGTALLNQQAMEEGDYFAGVKAVPEPEEHEFAIYRGWMLKSENYAKLYAALEKRGLRLINNPEEYQRCHEFPGTWKAIQNLAPPAVHVPVAPGAPIDETLFEIIERELRPFGKDAAILKDYVKSAKEYWSEACFIPDVSNREELERVVRRFCELRGELFTGGLVFKKHVELEKDPDAGRALPREYRLFYFNHMLLLSYPESVSQPMLDEIPIQALNEIAENVKSRFFSMDIGKDVSGRWWILEVGDGQVSGLPDKSDAAVFYEGIRNLGNSH